MSQTTAARTEALTLLNVALQAVRALPSPSPGDLLEEFVSALQNTGPRITANDEWREVLVRAWKQSIPAIEACLDAGLTQAQVNEHLAPLDAQLKPNGRRVYLSMPGGSGWFLYDKLN